MGNLAISLSNSVQGQFTRDENSYDRSLQKVPALWQSRIVHGISVLLCLGSLTFLIFGMVNLAQLQEVILQAVLH